MIIHHKFGTLKMEDSFIKGFDKMGFPYIDLFTQIKLRGLEFTDIHQYKDACVKLDALFEEETEGCNNDKCGYWAYSGCSLACQNEGDDGCLKGVY